jgi:hypothetical protein
MNAFIVTESFEEALTKVMSSTAPKAAAMSWRLCADCEWRKRIW